MWSICKYHYIENIVQNNQKVKRWKVKRSTMRNGKTDHKTKLNLNVRLVGFTWPGNCSAWQSAGNVLKPRQHWNHTSVSNGSSWRNVFTWAAPHVTWHWPMMSLVNRVLAARCFPDNQPETRAIMETQHLRVVDNFSLYFIYILFVCTSLNSLSTKQLEVVRPRLRALLSFVVFTFSFTTDGAVSSALRGVSFAQTRAVHRVGGPARARGAFTPQANRTRAIPRPALQVALGMSAVYVFTPTQATRTRDYGEIGVPH